MSPSWMTRSLVVAALISGVFVVAGMLLSWMRSWTVRWVAHSASGGITRHGSFAFGVGVPVPPDGSGVTYSRSERGSSDRGRRFTMLSGLLLRGSGR